jgi:ABC-type transport system involved in multi-copper enzyme maturation permease subunit
MLTFFSLFLPASLYFTTILPTLPAFFPSKESIIQFPSIWEYLGYAGNWMSFFFLGVLAIYLVSIEINNKTLRQSIIIGLSRQEYFLSKVLSIFILSIGATLFYTILCIIIGTINTETDTLKLMFDNNYAIPRFFLMTFGYLSFALFLIFIIRRSGIALFLYIAYGIIIEVLIRYFIIEKVSNTAITNYFPLNSFEDLMPNPAFKFTESIPNSVDFDFLLTHQQAALSSIIYIILFLGISYLSFMKRDI